MMNCMARKRLYKSETFRKALKDTKGLTKHTVNTTNMSKESLVNQLKRRREEQIRNAAALSVQNSSLNQVLNSKKNKLDSNSEKEEKQNSTSGKEEKQKKTESRFIMTKSGFDIEKAKDGTTDGLSVEMTPNEAAAVDNHEVTPTTKFEKSDFGLPKYKNIPTSSQRFVSTHAKGKSSVGAGKEPWWLNPPPWWLPPPPEWGAPPRSLYSSFYNPYQNQQHQTQQWPPVQPAYTPYPAGI